MYYSDTETFTSPSHAMSTGDGAKKLNTVIYLIATVILLNGLLNHSVETRANKIMHVGDKMPFFSLALAGGGEATEKDFAGKPAIYFFFAGWCPCSHASAPHIKRALAEYSERGLQILGIGLQDSEEKLAEFVKIHALPFPASPKGGEKVAREVGVAITPTTLFVDGEGLIRSFHVGRIDKYEQLNDGLEAILPSTINPAEQIQ